MSEQVITNNKQLNTTLRFQLFFLIIAISIISIVIYRNLEQYFFNSLDNYPEINIITPKEAKRLGNEFDKIEIKLVINNFKEFDLIKNSITFTGTLSFIFQPNITPLEKIKEFSFYNGKINSNQFYGLKQLSEDRFLAEFFIEVNMSAKFNYQNFPLDDHRLNIMLLNPDLSPIEAIHMPITNEPVIKDSASIKDWQLIDTQIYSGYLNYQGKTGESKRLNSAPCTVFSLSYTRSGSRPISTFFFPLFLIFFVAMLSLCMDPVQYKVSLIALSVACITALITYRFVIENIAPKTSDFMLGDCIFYTILLAVFIVFIINTYALSLEKKAKERLTIFLYSSTLAACIYFFEFWLEKK